MRLCESDRNVIKASVKELWDEETCVYLFGSRVDDTKKGGDIDLFIVSKPQGQDYNKKIELSIKLQKLLGEQKIDIVIAYDPTRLIEQEARASGVLL